MDWYTFTRGVMLVCDWVLFIVLVAAGLYTGLMSLIALRRIFLAPEDPDAVGVWLATTTIATIALLLVPVVGRRL